jgi:ABC-type multidrug transport system fused ATPase/permease subunit
MCDAAQERIAHIRHVRTFTRESAEVARYTAEVDDVLRLSNKETIMRASFYGIVGMVSGCLSAP